MATSIDDPVYEVFDVTKEFDGKRILSIPHLTFSKGKIYCLYGPNGSGKTTLFEILSLLQRPTHGRIVYNGHEVYPKGEGFSKLRLHTTLVNQNPLLFDTTVERNVDYGLRIRKVSRDERSKKVQECLDVVGLGGFQKRKSRTLSGGESQRVSIARALCISPQVLFLDEFSANIDYENRIGLENIIKNINRRYGTTIIFTTHYMDQAYRLSDNVVHIFKGRTVSAHIRNIFRGTIKKTDRGMVFENDKLTVLVKSPRQGEAVIAVPPEAITVSRDQLSSSMRNCLQGSIRHIIDDGKSVVCRIDTGEVLEVVITKESFREMGLEPGSSVYLYFKASSVEVL